MKETLTPGTSSSFCKVSSNLGSLNVSCATSTTWALTTYIAEVLGVKSHRVTDVQIPDVY